VERPRRASRCAARPTLDFWFPLWTPGAYHVADYGRFVKELKAFDEKGAELAVERDADELGHFVVHPGLARELVVRYQAEPCSSGQFTNKVIDVEANRIAAAYAYVNPPSLFGFVPERANEPCASRCTCPPAGRPPRCSSPTRRAASRRPRTTSFEDSPLLFSPTLETATFEVDHKPHRVSAHGRSAADVQTIAAGCKRIVEAGSKLMNGLPYDRYQFLYGFVDAAGGSGLEHSFSTLILTGPRTGIGEHDHEFWGVTAHEYFHLWCAERIHVAEIHHPDLTQPLETGTIWLNEGVTEYFSRHLLLHAGFSTQDELLASYFDNPGVEGMVRKEPWTAVSRATVEWGGMND
jgi:predicted metalloprotease with PDZ domain